MTEGQLKEALDISEPYPDEDGEGRDIDYDSLDLYVHLTMCLDREFRMDRAEVWIGSIPVYLWGIDLRQHSADEVLSRTGVAFADVLHLGTGERQIEIPSFQLTLYETDRRLTSVGLQHRGWPEADPLRFVGPPNDPP